MPEMKKNEWIIHIRILPKKFDKFVIKICNKWFNTQPIPQFITNFLIKYKFIRQYLLYKPEKKTLSKFHNARISKFITNTSHFNKKR